jgi:hypothetical protein
MVAKTGYTYLVLICLFVVFLLLNGSYAAFRPGGWIRLASFGLQSSKTPMPGVLRGIRILGVLVFFVGSILAVYVIGTILWIMTPQTGIF